MGHIRRAVNKVGGAIKKVGKTMYKHKGKLALAGAAAYHAGLTGVGVHEANNLAKDFGSKRRFTMGDGYRYQGRMIKASVGKLLKGKSD